MNFLEFLDKMKDKLDLGKGKPFLRPFRLLGIKMEDRIDDARILLVGINPATAIGPNDYPFEEYFEALKDIQKFGQMYQDARRKAGKPIESTTRKRVDNFIRSLQNVMIKTIVTNVIT